MALASDNTPSDRDVCAGDTHAVVRALARLLGRQAAREAFRIARTEAESSDDPASLSPATAADED